MYAGTKKVLLVIIGLLTAWLVAQRGFQNKNEEAMPDAEARTGTAMATGTPLNGTRLRFDGFYRAESAKVVYVVRFFPAGHAVLANGTLDVEHELPKLLVPNAVSAPRVGHYNVPVQARGDSLYFITHPLRGEIEYRGRLVDPTHLQFARHSHITGDHRVMDYLFQPDGVMSE